MNKGKGTSDNIIDVVKYLDEQKLPYVLAVWLPEVTDDKKDNVTLYTSYTKNSLKKISEVLKNATINEN